MCCLLLCFQFFLSCISVSFQSTLTSFPFPLPCCCVLIPLYHPLTSSFPLVTSLMHLSSPSLRSTGLCLLYELDLIAVISSPTLMELHEYKPLVQTRKVICTGGGCTFAHIRVSCPPANGIGEDSCSSQGHIDISGIFSAQGAVRERQ